MYDIITTIVVTVTLGAFVRFFYTVMKDDESHYSKHSH